MMRRFLFSTATIVDSSPSFAQRIRDLPKDLPGTNIKKEVSQVYDVVSVCGMFCVVRSCHATCALESYLSIQLDPSSSAKNCKENWLLGWFEKSV